ncbi:MAG TPA: alpha/beta hydrolase [Candidatus Limnocylindria bacterium]|nr:alpha/beta hydrolase [Candidatus Limnocylindria bacterium]
MKTTRHTISINGLDVAYYQFGHGTPLLFLHGGRVRALTFKRSLEQLSKRYTIIAPDIPGYGASATPKGEWSYSDYAVFFNSFLDKLELDDVTLVGYSMGGGIAFNLAAINSQVARLVLVDSSGLHAVNKRSNPHDLRRLSFYLKHPPYYSTLAVLLREYLQFIWKHRGDYSHMQHIRQSCRKTSYEKGLRKVSVPTLLVWAQDDRIIPVATANVFQKRIPKAVLKTVKGNHDWPLYKPAPLVKSILTWTKTT